MKSHSKKQQSLPIIWKAPRWRVWQPHQTSPWALRSRSIRLWSSGTKRAGRRWRWFFLPSRARSQQHPSGRRLLHSETVRQRVTEWAFASRWFSSPDLGSGRLCSPSPEGSWRLLCKNCCWLPERQQLHRTQQSEHQIFWPALEYPFTGFPECRLCRWGSRLSRLRSAWCWWADSRRRSQTTCLWKSCFQRRQKQERS